MCYFNGPTEIRNKFFFVLATKRRMNKNLMQIKGEEFLGAKIDLDTNHNHHTGVRGNIRNTFRKKN